MTKEQFRQIMACYNYLRPLFFTDRQAQNDMKREGIRFGSENLMPDAKEYLLVTELYNGPLYNTFGAYGGLWFPHRPEVMDTASDHKSVVLKEDMARDLLNRLKTCVTFFLKSSDACAALIAAGPEQHFPVESITSMDERCSTSPS